MVDRLPVATVRLLLGGRFWTAVLLGAAVTGAAWAVERLAARSRRPVRFDAGLVASVAILVALWSTQTLRSAWLVGAAGLVGVAAAFARSALVTGAAGAVGGGLAANAGSIQVGASAAALAAIFGAVPAATAATVRRWSGTIPFGWMMLLSLGGILVISPEPDAAVTALGASLSMLVLRPRLVGPTGLAVWSVVGLWVLGHGVAGRTTAVVGGVAAFAWLLVGGIGPSRLWLRMPAFLSAHAAAAWWGSRVAGLRDDPVSSAALAAAGLAVISLVAPRPTRGDAGQPPSV